MLAQRFFQFAVAHIRRNRLDYALGNAVLKVEQIIELALVLVGVDYFARGCVAEFGTNSQASSRPQYASMEHVAYPEMLPDRPYVNRIKKPSGRST